MQQIVALRQTRLYKTPGKIIPGGNEVCGVKWFVEQVLRTSENGKWLHLRLGYRSGDWWIVAADWQLLGPSSTNEGGAGAKTPKHRQNARTGQIKANQEAVWFSQRDNENPDGSCFSSCVAMAIATQYPGLIKDDSDYIQVRRKHGKSIHAQSHLDALKDYGLTGHFSQTKTLDWLKERAAAGKITCCGLLHRGHMTNVRKNSSGHYVVVFGYDKDKKTFKVNDPYGKYDWINGIHTGGSGANLVWPEEALYWRCSVEAIHGHLHCCWCLWID